MSSSSASSAVAVAVAEEKSQKANQEEKKEEKSPKANQEEKKEAVKEACHLTHWHGQLQQWKFLSIQLQDVDKMEPELIDALLKLGWICATPEELKVAHRQAYEREHKMEGFVPLGRCGVILESLQHTIYLSIYRC